VTTALLQQGRSYLALGTQNDKAITVAQKTSAFWFTRARRYFICSVRGGLLKPAAVAARGQGAPGQMTWLKGFRPGCRPGFRPGCHFLLSKEIHVYRRGTHK